MQSFFLIILKEMHPHVYEGKKTAALTIKNEPGTPKKQLQKRSDIKKETTRKEWPGGSNKPCTKGVRITPYLSVFSLNAGKTDQKNSEHGHFSRIESLPLKLGF